MEINGTAPRGNPWIIDPDLHRTRRQRNPLTIGPIRETDGEHEGKNYTPIVGSLLWSSERFMLQRGAGGGGSKTPREEHAPSENPILKA